MKIRIALAQINPTVGDFDGNVRAVRRMTAEAKKRGAQIVAFPELVLCGYPPEDLLLKPQFLKDCARALRAVAREAKGIVMLVGAPEPPARPGARPYNACHVLSEGKIAATYRKLNLPNYGVFDEKRYFEPGGERARRELRRRLRSEQASARTSGSTTGRPPRRCCSAARASLSIYRPLPIIAGKAGSARSSCRDARERTAAGSATSTSSAPRTSSSSTGAA